MPNPLTNRVIPLAAAIQAAQLAKQVAYHGSCDNTAAEATVGSLFRLDEGDVAAVYGGESGVAEGLRHLRRMLAGQNVPRDPEITKYLVGMLHLERKLANNRQILTTLRDGIDNARSQAEHFSLLHVNVLANLSDLYQRTISTLGPRIMIAGDPQRLNDKANQDRIRALLLAGIRSAMLWRHHGGSKWQLLFQRRRILEETDRILGRIPA
ncbi:high frequency lysogenization protein HflD [Endothiovibrio diazotrophicus]